MSSWGPVEEGLSIPACVTTEALEQARSVNFTLTTKKCEPTRRRARFLQLEGGDVRSLQALRALGYFELNRLAFVQRFVPLRLNGGEVDKNVLAGLALDESKALAGVEPLYCSLFFHLIFLFFKLGYLMLLERPQQKTKRDRECIGLAAPLNKSKGFTRATNAVAL